SLIRTLGPRSGKRSQQSRIGRRSGQSPRTCQVQTNRLLLLLPSLLLRALLLGSLLLHGHSRITSSRVLSSSACPASRRDISVGRFLTAFGSRPCDHRPRPRREAPIVPSLSHVPAINT